MKQMHMDNIPTARCATNDVDHHFTEHQNIHFMDAIVPRLDQNLLYTITIHTQHTVHLNR